MSSFRTPKGTELPLLDLKGKDYLQVQHRLVWFREVYPLGRITTECILRAEKFVVYKATIGVPRQGAEICEYMVLADGVKREDYAHFPDAEEKASTGAIGRALACAGFGTQFAHEDLDEADWIVDAPAPKPAQRQASAAIPPKAAPSVMDKPSGIVSPVASNQLGNYEIKVGKYRGKRLSDVRPEDLDNYLKWMEDEARKKGEELKGFAKELKSQAMMFYGVAP